MKITLKEFWNNKEKIAIHCDTQEKANKLCNAFHNMGKKWSDNDSYTLSFWNIHFKETCYCNNCMLGSENYYKLCNIPIYEFEDVIFKEEENE